MELFSFPNQIFFNVGAIQKVLIDIEMAKMKKFFNLSYTAFLRWFLHGGVQSARGL